MYSGLPFWRKVGTIAVSTTSWGLVGLSGVAATILTPVTVLTVHPDWLVWLWSALTTIGAVGGFIGAIRGKYQIEEIFAWFAAIGLTAYTAAVWALVPETLTRMPQALTVAALVGFVVLRAVDCSNKAYKVRKEQEQIADFLTTN